MTDTTPLNWMDRFNATKDVWIVQPGDYVALIHKEPMSDQERAIAKIVLEERWPDVHCVLFEGDWDIKVIRPPTMEDE